MIIVNKDFDYKNNKYIVEIDAYNYHYVLHTDNKKNATEFFNTFDNIKTGLECAYRDMIAKYPKEFPEYDRFMELLNNTIKELKENE